MKGHGKWRQKKEAQREKEKEKIAYFSCNKERKKNNERKLDIQYREIIDTENEEKRGNNTREGAERVAQARRPQMGTTCSSRHHRTHFRAR